MSVDSATIRRVARLARIALPEAEVPAMQGEVNAILGFVEQLAEVDVDGVEPMTSVTPMTLPMRDDVVTDGEMPALVTGNAPAREETYFLVPKVVE